MTKEQIISETIKFVKETLSNAEGGHDWWHIERVWQNSINIANKETKADILVVELGALLHDIADYKFNNGDEEIGPKKALDFLNKLNIDKETISHIINIIKNISFKGGNFEQKFKSLEIDIVQDADRLDAIGAIGIARCFNYGGYKNRQIYNPNIKPNLSMSKQEYKNSTQPTINHFYEKLLLIKDKMNTKTGKKIALKRHKLMLEYLDSFYKEWKGIE